MGTPRKSAMALRLLAAARVCVPRTAVACMPLSTKVTTGITGYAVVPDAPEVLQSLYAQTLESLQGIPEEAEYRKNVEAITNYCLKVVSGDVQISAIEEEVGIQVEEMIQDAKDELTLIPQMIEWKVWQGPAADISDQDKK